MHGTVEQSRRRRRSRAAARPDVPEHSFNLWSTYRLPRQPRRSAAARQIHRRLLLQQHERADDRQRRGDSAADALLAVQRHGQLPVNAHSTLQVNVNNLANERYVDRGYTGHFVPGAGRAVLRRARSSPSEDPEHHAAADSRRADRRAGRSRRAACSTTRDGSTAASPPAISRRGSKTTCSCPRIIRSRAELGDMILAALQRNPLFVSAALPLRVFPPLFNRYRGGQSFGNHVDNAIRQVAGTPHRIRTDLSATLFFAEPEEYDGGELVDRGHLRRAQREAAGRAHGALSRRPACTTCGRSRAARASPRSSGSRAWSATMAQRTLLFDLDTAIQRLVDGRARSSRQRAADGRVSQPGSAMGRRVMCGFSRPQLSAFSRNRDSAFRRRSGKLLVPRYSAASASCPSWPWRRLPWGRRCWPPPPARWSSR